MVTIKHLIEWLDNNKLQYYCHDIHSIINDEVVGPWNINESDKTNISFITKKWIKNNAKVVFTSNNSECTKDLVDLDSLVIFTDNVKLDFVKCINNFFKPEPCKVTKGNNVIIGEYCSIGKDGYQYILDEDSGKLIKFPHFGNIILEDDVEIGNNVCIARGALSNTILHKGVKVDNLVHIAHNVEIGENTQIIANAMIAGSVKIGKNCWISPSSSIKNQLVIGDNVLIGMGAVVIRNVESNSVMIGNPAKFLRKNL